MGADTQKIQAFFEKRNSKRDQIEAMRSKVQELIQEASSVEATMPEPQADESQQGATS